MGPVARAHIMKRIRQQDTTQKLTRWWNEDCGVHSKADPAIHTAYLRRMKELSK